MKTIVLAGMSKDKFTESIFEQLREEKINIINFTGHQDWDPETVMATINGIPSIVNMNVAGSFPGVKPDILDHHVLSFFEPIRPYFNRITDRFYFQNNTHRNTEVYFNELIAYVLGYLKQVMPISLFFSLYSPHSPIGLITYQACRYLGIRYCFGVRTSLSAKLMFSEYFDSNTSSFIRFDQKDFEYSLASKTNSKIKKLIHKTDWALDAGKAINKTGFMLLAQKSNSGTWKSKIAHHNLVKPHLGKIKPIYDLFQLLAYGKLLRNEFYGLSRLQAFRLVCKNFCKTLMIKKYLKEISVSTITHRRYVYFPLHYQPERTTDPESSYYTQQDLAIKLLSTIVPDDVHIYVKEHPRQLRDHFDVAKINFRSLAWYKNLEILPNVSFLGSEMDSAEIIDGAKLVATCCGSALWEGLLKVSQH